MNAESMTFRAGSKSNAMGRNGLIKMSGVAATYQPLLQRVMIAPLTSRGDVGNCRIEIPTTEISTVIEMLRQVTADAPATSPQELYLKNHGARCPACGNLDLDCDMLADNGEDARRGVKCLDCGAHWEDVYQLKKYVNLTPGKEG